MVRRKINLKKETSLTKIEPDFDAFIKELQDLLRKKTFAKTDWFTKILWAIAIILWGMVIILEINLFVEKFF